MNSITTKRADQMSVVIITCHICKAQFAPAPEHAYLLRVKPDALDAAFQSVCHVCFRCHRSACPECWDNVHRVCGTCVEEAGLTFRTEAAPLAGLLFPPELRTSCTSTHSSATPFVCIQPGHFEIERQQSADTDTPEAVAALEINEGLDTQTNQSEHRRPRTTNKIPIAIMDTTIQSQHGSETKTHIHGQAQTQLGTRLQTSARIAVLSNIEAQEQAEETYEDIDDELPEGSFACILKVVERVVTVVLLIVSVVVIAAIVLAEVSLPANGWIERLLHVDIRAEIAYLMILVRQIHW
jgi:hypothetical protein